jgi:hypothetical protein
MNATFSVTRLCKFWTIVYYGQCFKSYISSAKFWATIFHGTTYVLILTKYGLGYFLGDFFHKSYLVALDVVFTRIFIAVKKVVKTKRTGPTGSRVWGPVFRLLLQEGRCYKYVCLAWQSWWPDTFVTQGPHKMYVA